MLTVAPWCSFYYYCTTISQQIQQLDSVQVQILLAVDHIFTMARAITNDQARNKD